MIKDEDWKSKGYAYHPIRDEWKEIAGLHFPGGVGAAIDTYGVMMICGKDKAHLYKHKPMFAEEGKAAGGAGPIPAPSGQVRLGALPVEQLARLLTAAVERPSPRRPSTGTSRRARECRPRHPSYIVDAQELANSCTRCVQECRQDERGAFENRVKRAKTSIS